MPSYIKEYPLYIDGPVVLWKPGMGCHKPSRLAPKPNESPKIGGYYSILHKETSRIRFGLFRGNHLKRPWFVQYHDHDEEYCNDEIKLFSTLLITPGYLSQHS